MDIKHILMTITLQLLPSLQEDTLVFLTHVLLGLLDFVLELAKVMVALLNYVLHHETHCLVLVSVKDPVLKLFCLSASAQSRASHTC